MEDRARSRRAAGPPRGILRGRAPEGWTEHRRVLPCEAIAPFVAHFWWVRWALPAPAVVETLPHPSVHVVFEGGPGAEVVGRGRARLDAQDAPGRRAGEDADAPRWTASGLKDRSWPTPSN